MDAFDSPAFTKRQTLKNFAAPLVDDIKTRIFTSTPQLRLNRDF